MICIKQWMLGIHMLHVNGLIKGLEEREELQSTMQNSVSTGYIVEIVYYPNFLASLVL